MVPLGGDEDIGEVAYGLLEGNYPVWKSAIIRGPEAGPGLGNQAANTFVHP